MHLMTLKQTQASAEPNAMRDFWQADEERPISPKNERLALERLSNLARAGLDRAQVWDKSWCANAPETLEACRGDACATTVRGRMAILSRVVALAQARLCQLGDE
jgi:hypothetical protein